MLVAVSHAIRTSIREQDSASRWGGEEFLIVLPDTALDDATVIAQRIREKVLATIVTLDKHTVSTSVTLGVSSYANGETVGDAIARADELLYRGKKAGRNRVVSAFSADQ